MEKKNMILCELQEISPAVANLNKDNLFAVPVGYFDGLADEILAKTTIETLLGGAKSTLYSAPNGYFSDLAENILLKVKHENGLSNEVVDELQTIAPILNTISKEHVYQLPIGYFENVEAKIADESKAKVVSFGKWRKIVNYAAAAVFIGVLAIGGIKYIGNYSSKDIFEKEVAKSSDEEINQILDNHSSTAYTISNTVTEDQDEASIFEGTSEDELKQFLSEQPEMTEKLNKGI